MSEMALKTVLPSRVTGVRIPPAPLGQVPMDPSSALVVEAWTELGKGSRHGRPTLNHPIGDYGDCQGIQRLVGRVQR